MQSVCTQIRPNQRFGPDLYRNFLTLMVFQNFFEKTNQQMTIGMQIYPACNFKVERNEPPT